MFHASFALNERESTQCNFSACLHKKLRLQGKSYTAWIPAPLQSQKMPQHVIAKLLVPGGLILVIFVFSISHYIKKSDVFELGKAAVYQQLAKQGATEDVPLDMAWWESWSYADRGQTGNAHFVLCNKPKKVEHEGCFRVSAEKKEGQWKVKSVAMMDKQKK